jgi:hypothetical protein
MYYSFCHCPYLHQLASYVGSQHAHAPERLDSSKLFEQHGVLVAGDEGEARCQCRTRPL